MQNKAFDLGKKVFFLNTPKTFREVVVPMLSSSGYEVYCLYTYKQAKPILKEYPDSVFYICVDREMPLDEWYNYISSFSKEKDLNNIIIGLMSATAEKADIDHFLLNASIPGGFLSLNQQDVLIHDYIHSILLINEAKGKRNFVRANCASETNISANVLTKRGTKVFKVENISCAGMLCVTEKQNDSLFQANSILKSIIVDLNGKHLKFDTVIFKTYMDEDNLFLVLLFATDLPYAIRSIIDRYVRTVLQSKIDTIIETLPEDHKIYSKRQKSAIAGDSDEAFLISE